MVTQFDFTNGLKSQGLSVFYFYSTSLRACLHGGEGPQTGDVTCGGSPHLSCKHDQIKIRDYMDRWVTPT